ncbi:killer cell lectin-like receptor subfamily B member 1C [Xenopus tropicalis]|uniref:Killer cell lectin-like receptor subfamily B member 1C n=1 Tax=Xenopus tropicalis TaxID=8364 RepID=A0A8J1J1J9_XENTR|nr:killer cell lectin-like receptor subfamily B member 1C [Xenopus tropicalis]
MEPPDLFAGTEPLAARSDEAKLIEEMTPPALSLESKNSRPGTTSSEQHQNLCLSDPTPSLGNMSEPCDLEMGVRPLPPSGTEPLAARSDEAKLIEEMTPPALSLESRNSRPGTTSSEQHQNLCLSDPTPSLGNMSEPCDLEMGVRPLPPSERKQERVEPVTAMLLFLLLFICFLVQLMNISLRLRMTNTKSPEEPFWADVQSESREKVNDKPGSTIHQTGLPALCPQTWVFLGAKCYFISEERMKQEESESFCRERGSILLSVREPNIQRIIDLTGQEYWVGLKKLVHYKGVNWTGQWGDGSTETIIQNTDTSGTCAKLGRNVGLENCYRLLRWICERQVKA